MTHVNGIYLSHASAGMGTGRPNFYGELGVGAIQRGAGCAEQSSIKKNNCKRKF